jgi:hypothetical protein
VTRGLQQIGAVHAGGAYPKQYFTRPRARVGHLFPGKMVSCMSDDGAHDATVLPRDFGPWQRLLT